MDVQRFRPGKEAIPMRGYAALHLVPADPFAVYPLRLTPDAQTDKAFDCWTPGRLTVDAGVLQPEDRWQEDAPGADGKIGNWLGYRLAPGENSPDIRPVTTATVKLPAIPGGGADYFFDPYSQTHAWSVDNFKLMWIGDARETHFYFYSASGLSGGTKAFSLWLDIYAGRPALHALDLRSVLSIQFAAVGSLGNAQQPSAVHVGRGLQSVDDSNFTSRGVKPGWVAIRAQSDTTGLADAGDPPWIQVTKFYDW